MGYERTLLARWTRRDWLAIAVIALTTTFLVGTSIMLLATGTQLENEVETLDGLETAEFGDDPAVVASNGDVILPVAQAKTAPGTNVTVIGVPETPVNLISSFDDATLATPPPDGVVERGAPNRSTVRLAGVSGTLTLAVRDAPDRSVLPDHWYTARQETVRDIGQTGQFRIETDAPANATATSRLPEGGTFLLGTPGFLTIGGGEIVELLGLVTIASGLLIGVTVYSVTRMTVRDRRRTLFVIRSTGGPRRRLIGLFGIRAAMLTAVGAAFGYAIGIILINAVINVATYYGILTTLDVSGSPTDRLLLGGILIATVAVGFTAGVLSVIRTVDTSPASLMGTGTGVAGSDGLPARIRKALDIEVIGVRTVVPMTAALTVLVAIAVVSVSVGLTLAPLAGATDGVVMSPDASYPLQSEVDEKRVQSFRSVGIPASPEILLPQVRDGQPYVMRGVNYSAYRQVSDVSVTAGREPAASDEALIGAGLARTLEVKIGETVTVGGGTAFGIDRVTVVGRFDGPGYLDDQLLVSLEAAKQLANMENGTVQLIQTTGVEEPPDSGNETPTPTPTPADVVVTDVSVPETGIVDREVPIEVTLRNRGDQTGTRTLTVSVDGRDRDTRVTVDGGETRTVTRNAVFQDLGNHTVAVGDLNTTITVEPIPADIIVTGVTTPETAFSNQSVPVDVTLSNRGGQVGRLTLGVPFDGGTRERTVAVNGTREVVTTNGSTIVAAGGPPERTVTLTARFDAPGTYDLEIGGIETPIRVVEPAPANVTVTDVTAPERAFIGEEVPVNVTLKNSGDLAGNRTLTVPVNGTDNETTVTVRGGETRTVTLTAVYRTPGTYNLTVDAVDSGTEGGKAGAIVQSVTDRRSDTAGRIEIVDPRPANVSVTDVTAPGTWVANDSVPLEVTLKNRGDLSGNRTLTVPVDGTDRETTVTVPGRQTRTVTLSAVFRTLGNYTVTVGGIDAQIAIIDPGPADIVVTDVSVARPAFTNLTTPVDVTLENRGETDGTRTLSVPVDGTDRETTVSVPWRTRRTVTLTATFEAAGVYNVTVGGVQTQIDVVDPEPADVVVTNLSAPERALTGENVSVTVTLENRGDLAGDRVLSVPGGGTDSDRVVTLGAGEKRNVTLTATYRTGGSYTLAVGDANARIQVDAPAEIVVTNWSVPALGTVNASIPVEVTLRNRGTLRGNRILAVPANGTDRRTNLILDGRQERTVTLDASFRTPGGYALTIGGEEERIRILRPAEISLNPLPAEAPPNTTLLVTVRNRTDAGVAGVQLRLGGTRTQTGPDGTARVQLPGDPGGYRLRSVVGGQVVHNRSLEVTAGVERSVLTTLQVRPEEVSLLDEVEATATAYNPWGTTLTRDLVVQRDGETVSRRTVELSPGETRVTTTSVEPGTGGETQQVRVLINGTVTEEATFTVEVSDRFLAVLARLGLYESGSGLQESLESLIGNAQVLVLSLIVLSFLVGVGSTATVVIQATHARRRTIGIQRVTGATPRDVARMLLGDGLRVGGVASAIGVVGAYASLALLVEVGYAVIFGVRIPPLLNPWLVLGVLGGALAVVATSSLIAAWWVLRVSPGALVTASTRRVPDRDDGQSTLDPEVEG